MKDVKPTSLLKDRGREVEGNPDFSNKDVASSQTPVAAEVSSGVNPPIKHVDLQPEVNSTSRTLSLPTMVSQDGLGMRYQFNHVRGCILVLLYFNIFYACSILLLFVSLLTVWWRMIKLL
jgi:hypothetical protein